MSATSVQREWHFLAQKHIDITTTPFVLKMYNITQRYIGTTSAANFYI